jgi:hypothetical protein
MGSLSEKSFSVIPCWEAGAGYAAPATTMALTLLLKIMR